MSEIHTIRVLRVRDFCIGVNVIEGNLVSYFCDRIGLTDESFDRMRRILKAASASITPIVLSHTDDLFGKMVYHREAVLKSSILIIHVIHNHASISSTTVPCSSPPLLRSIWVSYKRKVFAQDQASTSAAL